MDIKEETAVKREIKTLKKAAKKVCGSPESAKKFLMSLGMYTKGGKLKKKFR